MAYFKVYKLEGVKRDHPIFERDVTTQTEQVGYVSAEAQVMRMLSAGVNLRAYHRAAYDYPDGEVDVEKAVPDPTLKVGFDPADASFFMRRAISSLEAAKAAAELKRSMDKKEEATEEAKQ